MKNTDITTLISQAAQRKSAQHAPRNYLGASIIGTECLRQLQYSYLNAKKDEGREFSGMTLRVFDVGHTLETRMQVWLEDAGFVFRPPPDGRQHGFSDADGKFKGHCDGIIEKVPDGVELETPCIWECKTMKDSKFKQTDDKGIADVYPAYIAQIHTYQAYLDLTKPALLTILNKNTQEIHVEKIAFDAKNAQSLSDKAVMVLKASDALEPLPQAYKSPNFFQCRYYCDWRKRCWKLTD